MMPFVRRTHVTASPYIYLHFVKSVATEMVDKALEAENERLKAILKANGTQF